MKRHILATVLGILGLAVASARVPGQDSAPDLANQIQKLAPGQAQADQQDQWLAGEMNRLRALYGSQAQDAGAVQGEGKRVNDPQESRGDWGFPKINPPKLPKLDPPKLPKLDPPKLPKLDPPKLPKLDPPKLPKIDFPHIRLPDPRTVTRVETNRNQVKAALRKGWDLVAFGKEVDHAEYVKLTAALAAAVASENPAPVKFYLQNLLYQMRHELMRNLVREGKKVLPKLTERVLLRALDNAVHGRKAILKIEGIDVEIGIATYNHWKKISGQYPKIDKGRVKWESVEKKIPLPNTHQPFVRLRVRFR